MKNMKKNVVVGLGEIGKPILKILSKSTPTIGYDINQKLVDKKQLEKYYNVKTSILHICIPFAKNFESNVISYNKKFKPEIIVIHSTISPGTTENLQAKLLIPIIYSAIRGVHKRMVHDIKRYAKFFAFTTNAPHKQFAIKEYSKLLKKCGIKTKKMSNSRTLELAKIICDTSYLGWLVNYAQISNAIAIQHGVNYDEMWSFSDEIHKYLGNRPKMYPDIIGGHCVIPNLDLIHNQTLDLIKKLNQNYEKTVKNTKIVSKKYKSFRKKTNKHIMS